MIVELNGEEKSGERKLIETVIVEIKEKEEMKEESVKI